MEMTSVINWQKGNPTEYGSYLVLHRDHLGRFVIDHDIWFDDSQRWQSQWRGIVAWCAFSDIKVRVKPKDNIIVQKCLMSCAFFKLMEKDGKASCTIWLDEAPTICDLYVNDDQRRQGLATEMLQMCEDLVKAEGYPGVFLYTDEGSWLVDWYERKGYKKTGETLQVKGQTVTSLWMYKEL